MQAPASYARRTCGSLINLCAYECGADTELLLQKVCYFIFIAHSVTAAIAANMAGSKGLSPAVTGIKVRANSSAHLHCLCLMPVLHA